jgi:hypothetical protein
MITTNEQAVVHRKNRKNKSQLQASQEMVNAFDKISVSVRRAYNVNRCQQDHLDSKVSTLENEHRKSMGLLALEQRRFIRTRKSSKIPHKSQQKHRQGRKLSNLANEKDGIKASFQLPSLVNKHKFQDDDSVETFKRHALNRGEFVGWKRRNSVQKQDLNKRIHLPSIREAQLNKAGQYKEKDVVIEAGQDPVGKRISRNNSVRRDTVDKQQYVASWDISASEETNGKSYSDLDKTPLTLNTQLRMDESTSTKPKAHAYSDNKTITENPETAFSERGWDTKNESPSLSSNRKFHLARSRTNTTSELGSILDESTEIRVRQFLKLPPIGGIDENPSPEQPHSEFNDQPESHGNKRSNDVNLDMGRQRAKSSLWKNLVHCRYLRLGEQHVCQHRITNKNCECNWCAMMRKSRA